MEETNMQLNNSGRENPDGTESSCSATNPGSGQPGAASAGSISAPHLNEWRTQNIGTLQRILNDLLAQYEELKSRDDNASPARASNALRDVRLVMKLLDSLINNVMNPKNKASSDGLLTEAGAAAFAGCVGAYLQATDRFVRQELFAADPAKAEDLLNRLAEGFDEAFGVFATTDSEEEN